VSDSGERLTDAALIARLVYRKGDQHQSLEAELTQRAQDPSRRLALKRLLEGYALGADEYLGEDTQAAARHYLAALS
jgi:hypothetical protein